MLVMLALPSGHRAQCQALPPFKTLSSIELSTGPEPLSCALFYRSPRPLPPGTTHAPAREAGLRAINSPLSGYVDRNGPCKSRWLGYFVDREVCAEVLKATEQRVDSTVHAYRSAIVICVTCNTACLKRLKGV